MQPDYFNAAHNLTLYNADCLDVLPTLAPASIGLIWTDPPYGHNQNAGNDFASKREVILGLGPKQQDRPIANDSMPAMRRVVDAMLTHAARLLAPVSAICCCCGGGGPSPTFAWIAQRMDAGGLKFFQAVVWDKGGLGIGWRYRRNYEFVMVAHPAAGRLKWEHNGAGMETANVVRIPKIIPSATDHPTPKPVELIEHFLRLHARPGDVILDPFMGHAPVGVAALRAGCAYIDIELDPAHFARARERLEQEIIDLQGGPLFAQATTAQESFA